MILLSEVDLSRILIDNGDFGVIGITAEKSIALWNPWLTARTGLPTETVIDRPLFDIFPHLPDHTREALQWVLESGQPRILSPVLHAPWITVNPPMRQYVRLLPLRNKIEEVIGALILIHDLTGTVEFEQTTARKFRSLIEGVKDYAIFMLDPAGLVASWNRGAKHITGYQTDEIIGKHFSCFYTSEDIQNGKPDHALEAAVAEGRHEAETWQVRKDGSRFMANVVISALYDEAGHLDGFAGVTRDITERRQAEEVRQRLYEQVKHQAAELELRVAERTVELEERVVEVERLNRQMTELLQNFQSANEHLQKTSRHLEEANADLQAFSYTVSHDLRAPLRGIQGFARILVTDHSVKMDDAARECARHIRDAAERMDALIQDLLAYSKIGRAEIQLKPLNLSMLVQEVIKEIEPEIVAKGGHLRVLEPLPQVRAHWVLLSQVLNNLLSNAIKFVASGVCPEVEIGTEYRKEGSISGDSQMLPRSMVRMWIADNGIGVAPEDQERIFRVFERLHGMDIYPGTGVGLAIVKKAVERMNGQVGVESEPGKGSVFWIELPGIV